MLELKNVSFAYAGGNMALNDVSLSIGAGEFVAIAGRNGSGKTTLTKLMMSLLKPAEGQVYFNGQDTRRFGPADMAREIGYVFQNPDRQMFRDTVRQEVSYGPQQLGFAPEAVRCAVDEALAAVGLSGYEEAYPRTLPKGLKQRVTIASALAMQPKVLILDEPTSGQDAKSRESIMRILVELNAAGKTVILVTHDMDTMARYAKRAVVMDRGRKVFDGCMEHLFAAEQDYAAWGLREPAAVKISRGLADYGITPAYRPQDLCRQILKLTGGAANA